MVTNSGSRAGSDVLQLYVEPPEGPLMRPRGQLCGVAKVHLEPGATTTATIELRPRSFAYWDPANTEHLALRRDMAAEALPSSGGADASTTPGWYISPGDYRLCFARSIAEVVHTKTFNIDTGIGPLTSQESLP